MSRKGLVAVGIYILCLLAIPAWILGVAYLPDPWWYILLIIPCAILFLSVVVMVGMAVYEEFKD